MTDFKPIGSKQIRKQTFGECDILQKGDLISLAPSTGLICVTSRENRISGNRPNFSILHPNGKLISSIKWNSAQIICLFWASDREIINVITDNGKLLQFDINCQLTRQLTICSEEILEGKSFVHRDTGRHCVVYLTTTCRFSFMADCDDPNRIIELGQLQADNLPDCWTITYQNGSLALVAFFGSLYMTRKLASGYNQTTNQSTENLRLSKNFNCITVLTASLDGKYLAASTDSGIHAIVETDTMEPLAEMNTAQAKITQPPLQVEFVSFRDDPIVALLWHHMLLIFDKAKHWVKYDIDQITSIHSEIDGIRILNGLTHDFLSMVDNSTTAVYSPGAPGNLLVDSFHLFQQEDERAEEIISTLRDSNSPNGALLPVAVGQCTLAATAELDIFKQKEFLSSASFGKTLTDEVDYKLFSRTNRILRVLNHLRNHSSIFITYTQFVKIGPFGVIDRLLARNEHKLSWHIANHLQLVEDQPNVKEKIFSSWAQSIVRNMGENDDNEQITSRIRHRTAELDVNVNFIEIAQQAAEMGNVNLAYKLIDCEARHKPRVELLLKIDSTGEKALQCALESHDPDLIYLSLLHVHSVSSADDYQKILKKYPKAANQYAIYCRENNRKVVGQFKSKRDESFYLATIQLKNAEKSRDADECMESLNDASKTFKLNNDFQSQFAHRMVESQKNFIQKCAESSIPTGHANSVKAALKYLLSQGEYQKAEQLKREMKFNDVHFFRLRLLALGRAGDFSEIEKTAKNRKSPIGLEFFIKVCMENGRPDEAEKYLAKMTGKNRVHGLLEMKRYIDAADVANSMGDIDLVEKENVKIETTRLTRSDMNPAKLASLQAMSANVRIGGKGTARRKKKIVHKASNTDDKKLQSQLKKLSINPIPGIEEVNMFKDDGSVIHFTSPKVQASPQANTFAISGQAETKQVSEMLPSIVNQLGPEGFASLRKLAMEKVPAAKDDDVPELEGDFEEASKQEEEQSKAAAE